MPTAINLWPLIGIAVIIAGFILRFNTMLVVIVTAIVTAAAANFSPEQILAELSRKRLFNAERVSEISALFRDLGDAPAALLSRKRLKLARDRVQQLARKVMEILAEIEERSAT